MYICAYIRYNISLCFSFILCFFFVFVGGSVLIICFALYEYYALSVTRVPLVQ